MGHSLLFVLLSTSARATTTLAATGDTGLTGGTEVAPTGETGLVDTGTTGTTPPETLPPTGTTPTGSTPTESGSTGDTGSSPTSDTAAPLDPSLVVTAASLAGEEGGVGCDHGARRSLDALGVLACSLPWLIRRREA